MVKLWFVMFMIRFCFLFVMVRSVWRVIMSVGEFLYDSKVNEVEICVWDNVS